MPNAPKRKTRRGQRKGAMRSQADGPSANSLVYRGPFVPRPIVMQEQLVLKCLKLATDITSTGAGVINNTFGLQNPSSFPAWTNLAAEFDEYRVLAAKLTFTPSNGYNKVVATQTCVTPIFVVLDRDSVSTLATRNAALFYDSCKMFDLERPFVFAAWKMNGAREATFLTTASPTNLGCYAFFANNLSATLQYGTVLFELLVQFRASA